MMYCSLNYWARTLSSCLLSAVCLSSVCLSRVRCRKLSEIGAKFCRLYRKSGSPSKNMTSDFAREVAKYPKSRAVGSVRAYCFAPPAMQLVSIAACVERAGGCSRLLSFDCSHASHPVLASESSPLGVSYAGLFTQAVSRHRGFSNSPARRPANLSSILPLPYKGLRIGPTACRFPDALTLSTPPALSSNVAHSSCHYRIRALRPS